MHAKDVDHARYINCDLGSTSFSVIKHKTRWEMQKDKRYLPTFFHKPLEKSWVFLQPTLYMAENGAIQMSTTSRS